jgi:hypothetical protein
VKKRGSGTIEHNTLPWLVRDEAATSQSAVEGDGAMVHHAAKNAGKLVNIAHSREDQAMARVWGGGPNFGRLPVNIWGYCPHFSPVS